MKVPNEVVGRTRPSSQGLSYFSDAGASPAAFGAAIGTGLTALASGLRTWEERDQKTQHFGALRDFSEFETQVSTGLTELKRSAPPDGRGYVKMAEDYYKKAEQEFLTKTIPQELRPEFEARSGEIRQRVLTDSISFQYTQGDAFYKVGVDQEFQKGLRALDPSIGGDPNKLEYWRGRMNETIDATDLPESVKADLRQKVAIGLEGVSYKAKYKEQAVSGGVPSDASNEQIVDRIIGVESGGKASAKNPNSSASGVGQFLDSTWVNTVRRYRPDIAEGKSAAQIIALKGDKTLGREMTLRYTEENQEYLRNRGVGVTPGKTYLAHFLGPAGAVQTAKADPSTPIANIVGQDVIRANPFLRGKTAADVIAWADKKMGGPAPNIESDAAYANLPYEDRINLRSDADTEIVAERTKEQKAAAAEYATSYNSLLNSIMDGTSGRVEIDAAAQNWMSDAGDRKRAYDLLEETNRNTNLVAAFQQKLENPIAVYDPTDETQKKAYNQWVGPQGLARIAQGDQGYFSNTLLPTIQQTHDIPTDVIGQLMGMVRSSNQTQALFALDALSQIRNADQRAFDMRTPDALAKDVDFYSRRKGLYPADELLGMINGGQTQEERQRRKLLQEEAQSYLSSSEKGETRLRTGIGEVLGEFGGLFSSAEVVSIPSFASQLEEDYQTAFTDAFVRLGNFDDAHAAATEVLKRDWMTTSVGKPILMKYAPERVGYQPLGGDYSWINQQVRQELQLGPTGQFQLISDDQTANEFHSWQRGQGNPASYMIVTQGEDGAWRLKMAEDGKPFRMFFKPEQADIDNEIRDFQRQNAINELENFIPIYEGAKQLELYGKAPFPEEYEVEKKRLESEVEKYEAPSKPFELNLPGPPMPLGPN